MGLLTDAIAAREAQKASQAAAGLSAPPSQLNGSGPLPAQPAPPSSGAGPSIPSSLGPNYSMEDYNDEFLAKRRAERAAAAAAAAPKASQPIPASSAAALAAARESINAKAAAKNGVAAALNAPVPALGANANAPRRRGSAATSNLRKARPAPAAKARASGSAKKRGKAAKKSSKRPQRDESDSPDEDEEQAEEEDVWPSGPERDEDMEDLEDQMDVDEDAAGPSTRGKRKTRATPAAPAAASPAAPAAAKLPVLWDLIAESEAEAAAEAERVAAEAARAAAAAAAKAVSDAMAAPDPGEFRVSMNENGRDCGPHDEVYLDIAVPGRIAHYLRPYQRAGIRFLMSAYAKGRGALLADDMGLGKTLQSVAFLAAVLGKTGDRKADLHVPKLSALTRIAAPPTSDGIGAYIASTEEYAPDYSVPYPALVVATSTLLDNWLEEFNKWGSFRVHKFISGRVQAGVATVLSGAVEVALVTYDTLRVHAEDICSVPWHLVIYDEAHALKNRKALQTRAADRLPTPLRFGLTGTPMPNDYKELFNLMDLLSPGALGTSASFNANFATPIKKGQKAGATQDQIADGSAAQVELRKRLRPLMLRRTKAIIAAQLPKKKDHVVLCRMTAVQMRVYKRLLSLPDVSTLLLQANDPCPCESGEVRRKCDACDGEYWRLSVDQGAVIYPHFHDCNCDNAYDPISRPNGCKNHRPYGCYRRDSRICPYCIIMPLITLLRKTALHLDLLKARPADEGTVNQRRFEWDQDVAAAAFGDEALALGGLVQSDVFTELANVKSCGKLRTLKALLDDWSGRSEKGKPIKVLIFSMSVRMLKIVEAMAVANGWSNVIMTGSVPPEERQGMVNTFNNDATFLFLASTQVGGVGLNLTGANKVVILDPSYNPAQDLQSMDRAFRIGQSRDVDVYRLVAAGTIEETVYLRQVSKQQHSAIAVEGGADLRRLFTGVQGHEKGELWGFQALLGPLLASEAQRVSALDILDKRNDDAEDAKHIDPEMIEVPYEVSAEMEAAWAAGGGRGHAAAAAGELEEGFDAGLAAALGANDDGTFGAEVLDLPGVAGVIHHEAAMAPSRREAAQRATAVGNRERAKARAYGGVPGSRLECLASWQGKTVVEMAEAMLAMTEEQRTELRQRYAAAAPEGPLNIV